MEFIGTDNVSYLISVKFAVVFKTGDPITRGIEKKLIAVLFHKVLVACHGVVKMNAVSDVGGYMLFDLACFAPARSLLIVVEPCGFPREHCPLVAVVFRLFTRSAEPVPTRSQQTSRNRRSRENECGKHIYFRVPERVTAIAGAGKSLCADIHAVVMRGSHNAEVIYSESVRKLIEVIFAVDLRVHIVPDFFLPCGSGCVQQRVKALFRGFQRGFFSDSFQFSERKPLGCSVTGGIYRSEFFESQGLPRTEVFFKDILCVHSSLLRCFCRVADIDNGRNEIDTAFLRCLNKLYVIFRKQ